MSNELKITLYVCLLISVCTLGYFTHANYALLMSEKAEQQLNTAEASESAGQKRPVFSSYYSRMMGFGTFFFLSVVGLGILVAYDISQYAGARAAKIIEGQVDEGETKSQAYEAAESAWAAGDYLQAIQLLRDYLQQNPKEIHAAIRIAEIYEKNLGNHLAAALEYEEILTHKIRPEKWGATAIHLANLYSGKLRQPEKAVALLRRIAAEYGQTKAAEKARKRLEMYDNAGSSGLIEE